MKGLTSTAVGLSRRTYETLRETVYHARSPTA